MDKIGFASFDWLTGRCLVQPSWWIYWAPDSFQVDIPSLSSVVSSPAMSPKDPLSEGFAACVLVGPKQSLTQLRMVGWCWNVVLP